MKDAASITTGMRLEAKRLGIHPSELGGLNICDAQRVDAAIRRAVKAERERCVKCVQDAANCKIIATSGLAAMRVMEQVAIEAINTPAKRPSKRKGKR
jgi:hypothetical protein